uniref:Kinesin motor domain-containing protein n=1 Tax=Heterorhabditis bacteriophora TaxID=37862 RepID=A0A1I7WVD0_HETBA
MKGLTALFRNTPCEDNKTTPAVLSRKPIKIRLLLVDPERYENNILRQNRQHERQFSFDAAFGPSSTQVTDFLFVCIPSIFNF